MNAAIFQANQRRKLISTALTTRDNRGHCNQDKASFVESVLTAIAPSPERPSLQQNVKTPSLRSQILAVGLLHSTGVCKFKNAMKKREAVRKPNSKISWSQTQRRKGFSKITELMKKQVLKWVLDHKHVVHSPISDDTVLVKNSESGQKERVPKLLLQVPVRELHNDLLMPANQGGLACARDIDGKVLISDTSLQKLLSKQLCAATKRHKQMCGCEICLTIQSHQQSLNHFCNRMAKKYDCDAAANKDNLELQELELEYRKGAFSDGQPLHAKPRDAMASVMCPNVQDDLPAWSCVLRRCPNCPTYQFVHPVEADKSPSASKINFHVYVPVVKCSKHGVLPPQSKTCLDYEVLSENKKKGKVST